jgi:hypothetical protein
MDAIWNRKAQQGSFVGQRPKSKALLLQGTARDQAFNLTGRTGATVDVPVGEREWAGIAHQKQLPLCQLVIWVACIVQPHVALLACGSVLKCADAASAADDDDAAGSLLYMAPEVFREQPYSEKVRCCGLPASYSVYYPKLIHGLSALLQCWQEISMMYLLPCNSSSSHILFLSFS